MKLDEVEVIAVGFANTCPLDESTKIHLKTVIPDRERKDLKLPVWSPTVALTLLNLIELNSRSGRLLVGLYSVS